MCSSNTPSAIRANSTAYGENCWGITASDGPGWVTRQLKGKERHFFGYVARGVPDGPDDGTIAPWAVVASLPFAPQIVLPTLQYFDELNLRVVNNYGYKATFNPTFPSESADAASWVSPWHLGLNQGPVVLMIENYRSGLLWSLMCQCPYLVSGLRGRDLPADGWRDTIAPLRCRHSAAESRKTLMQTNYRNNRRLFRLSLASVTLRRNES